MTNESLLAAIERFESLADSYGSVSDDRATAIDRYLGRPMGNEVDGRSQVVSRDVYDTVEWIKPQIADIFCSGDQVVAFTPRGPEDVKAAEQETEYVNHIVTERNDWFTVFTGWSHDALLQRNGYVIAHYELKDDRTKEKYAGLTDDDLNSLLAGGDVEVLEYEQTEQGHNVTIQQGREYGCVKIENVPPERVLVSHNAPSLNLQDPRLDFCEYWEYKTISDLRDEGFEVEDTLTDHSEITQDWEEDTRDDNNPFRNRDGEESSPAARRLKVRNVWIRYDGNDDGLTELRRVVVVGKTILLDEEAEEVTLVALCPIALPHQHVGLSVADAVMDLEKIKTALIRGSLDNVYLANNGRHAINTDAVNMDDMLVSRPGGVVRVSGNPADHIMPLTHSTTGQVAIPMLEYVDRIQQKRTGVSDTMQGTNPNSLNNSLGAQTNMAMVTAAQQRIKFIARTFAETGVKNLFRLVHSLSLKNARAAEIVQLRSQWVQVDPRHWKKRTDMSISVGLGSGDRPQQIAMLTQILGIQAQAAAFKLASPVNVYNTLKRLTQAAGYKDPAEFWTDPSTVPPTPPQPPIELLKVQAEGQMKAQLEQQRLAVEMQTKREEHQLKLQELRANLELQASNDMRDSQREQLRTQMQAEMERMRLALDEWKASLEAQMQQYKTDQDNATKLQLAGLEAERQREAEHLRIGHEAMQSDAERASRMQMQSEAKKPEQKASADVSAVKAELSEVSKAIKQLAEMQKQLVQGHASLEKAVRAKRVLVRDAEGRASHSELQD